MPDMKHEIGSLYMVDGNIWRCCCIDEEGADLHMVNRYLTKHYSPEDWEFFKTQFEVVGNY